MSEKDANHPQDLIICLRKPRSVQPFIYRTRYKDGSTQTRRITAIREDSLRDPYLDGGRLCGVTNTEGGEPWRPAAHRVCLEASELAAVMMTTRHWDFADAPVDRFPGNPDELADVCWGLK